MTDPTDENVPEAPANAGSAQCPLSVQLPRTVCERIVDALARVQRAPVSSDAGARASDEAAGLLHALREAMRRPETSQEYTVRVRSHLDGGALSVMLWSALAEVAASVEVRPVLPDLARLRRENADLRENVSRLSSVSFEGARAAGERVAILQANLDRLSADVKRLAESTGVERAPNEDLAGWLERGLATMRIATLQAQLDLESATSQASWLDYPVSTTESGTAADGTRYLLAGDRAYTQAPGEVPVAIDPLAYRGVVRPDSLHMPDGDPCPINENGLDSGLVVSWCKPGCVAAQLHSQDLSDPRDLGAAPLGFMREGDEP